MPIAIIYLKLWQLQKKLYCLLPLHQKTGKNWNYGNRQQTNKSNKPNTVENKLIWLKKTDKKSHKNKNVSNTRLSACRFLQSRPNLTQIEQSSINSELKRDKSDTGQLDLHSMITWNPNLTSIMVIYLKLLKKLWRFLP